MHMRDFTHCFAVPGENHIVDVVHPATGRSLHFDRTLEEVQAHYPGAVLMPWEDWRQEQIKRQQTPITWGATTEHQYRYALEVLPPVEWRGGGFLLGEPYDHDYATGAPRFHGYRQQGYRHFVSSRPLTVAEFREELRRPVR